MNADDFADDKNKYELIKIKTLDLNQLEQDYKVEEKNNIYLDEVDLGLKQNWQ